MEEKNEKIYIFSNNLNVCKQLWSNPKGKYEKSCKK